MAASRGLAVFLLLLAFVSATNGFTLKPKDELKTDEEEAEKMMRVAEGLEVRPDDVIMEDEEISFSHFLNKFKENMAPGASVGDEALRHELNDLMYEAEHPFSEEDYNEFTRFQEMCRHLVERDHMSRRVKRATGRLPVLYADLHTVCGDFLQNPSKQNVERLQDIDAEMIREVVCLESGVPVGLEETCQTQLQTGESLLDKEDAERAGTKDMEIPTAEEVQDFNENLREYCSERNMEDHERVRRSVRQEALHAADMLEYFDCMCDNKTTCGHLAHQAAHSFGEHILIPLARDLEQGLQEGQDLENTQDEQDDSSVIAPGNFSYPQARDMVESYSNHSGEHHRRRARSVMEALKGFKRVDLAKFPLKQLAEGIGCAIVLHKDRPIQVFACTFYKVLKIELKLIWTNILPRIELNIKLCVPIISDIVDFITKYVKPLNKFLKQFDIENGCFLIAKAYVDFYKGIFEVFSNVPQLSVIVARAKLRSSFLIRFDPNMPWDNSKERTRLNKYGERMYMQVNVNFKVEYFEFWKLFWGKWNCIWCKTLIDKAWPLGSDKSPLRTEAAAYTLEDDVTEGTGRLMVLNSATNNWGTVCNDGWGWEEGEVVCKTLGYHGYMGLWPDVTPGEGEIILGGLNCVGTENSLLDCPRSKDAGSTGCEHSEDIGIMCFTGEGDCQDGLLSSYDYGPDQLTSSGSTDFTNLHLDSESGWEAGSGGPHWIQLDLWFNHQISGLRMKGHKSKEQWVTKFKVMTSMDGETWATNQDEGENDVVYPGNIDRENIKSAFWWPPVRARFVKLMIEESHGDPALRLEIHGCGDGLTEFAEAYQSSVLFGGFAKFAIDGIKRCDFKNDRSCTHTNEERNPWWAMDMKREMVLEGIRITNRKDCCGNRLKNFLVEVGNDIAPLTGVQGEICADHSGAMSDGESKMIRCEGYPRGRYVQIRLKEYGILSLCEVEVWALPAKLECDKLEGERVECAFDSQAECETGGCCWDGSCYSIRTEIPKDEDCVESLFKDQPDVKVTASTVREDELGGDFGVSRSRLDTRVEPAEGAEYKHGGWSSLDRLNEFQYIQVEFPEIWTVRKIITQGADGAEEWVKEYKLYYSYDGHYWSTNGGIIMANEDSTSYAVQEYQRFAAKFIRINPVSWFTHISMRFDILGCKVCEISLVERAPLVAFAASSTKDDNYGYGPHRARINTMERTSPFMAGGWTAGRDAAGEYIEVDLGGVRTVRKIVLQGAYGRDEYVRRLAISYSNDAASFQPAEEIEGLHEGLSKVYRYLKKEFTARYVRFAVVEWHGHISLRFDLLGCNPAMTMGHQKAAASAEGAPHIGPSLFVIPDRLIYSEAEAKCKDHGARLATPEDLEAAHLAGFEYCIDGWLSDKSVRTPLLHDHLEGDGYCGDAGITNQGSPPESKLFAAFCAVPGGGMVFYPVPYELAACNYGDIGKANCQKIGGRIAMMVEAEPAQLDGYSECRTGWTEFDDLYGAIQGKIGCNPDHIGLEEDDTNCQKSAFCAVPELTAGMVPAKFISLRPLQQSDPVYENGDHKIGFPGVDETEYLLGIPDAKRPSFTAEQPYDSGLLSPAENLELVTSDDQMKFYHPICPKGFVAIGDVGMTHDMDSNPGNIVRSQFRCVSIDMVQPCKLTEKFFDVGGGSLWRVGPSRGTTQLDGSYFLASSSTSQPPADRVFCLKQSHAKLIHPRLYLPFKPDHNPSVPLVMLKTTGTVLLGNSDFTIFAPNVKPGQAILGFPGAAGQHTAFPGDIYIAGEQLGQNILRPVKEFVTAPVGDVTAFMATCEEGYEVLGVPLIKGSVGEVDDHLRSHFRCVKEDYVTECEAKPSGGNLKIVAPTSDEQLATSYSAYPDPAMLKMRIRCLRKNMLVIGN